MDILATTMMMTHSRLLCMFMWISFASINLFIKKQQKHYQRYLICVCNDAIDNRDIVTVTVTVWLFFDEKFLKLFIFIYIQCYLSILSLLFRSINESYFSLPISIIFICFFLLSFELVNRFFFVVIVICCSGRK